MRTGTVSLTLRPIKVAFIVDISEKEAVLEAIRINSLLWGGVYNPIIPYFERKPKVLANDLLFKLEKNEDILRGYLNAYDPDYVLQLGKCANKELNIDGREKIPVTDILSGLKDDGTVGYGIGVYEVLNYFYEKELKFVRKKPIVIVKPKLPVRNHLFFASVFGELPAEAEAEFTKNYSEPLNLKSPICNLANYHSLLEKGILFVRRFTALYIEPIRRSRLDDRILFLLDPTSTIDIIDYWNLRALGVGVMPIPKQSSNTEEIKKVALKYIDESFGQHRYNPQLFYTATLQKGRSISEDEARGFLKFLDVKPDSSGRPKISARFWYPRIWDEWTRGQDMGGECDLEADTAEKDISGAVNSVDFKTLTPEFMSRFGGHGKPRFANEIQLKTYGDEKVIAEVMPKGNEDLANSIGGYGFKEWRLSNKGLVYLSQYANWSVHLPLPEAEYVFLNWIKFLGWEAKISAAGHVGKQIIKHLGGMWGIQTIAKEGMLDLLGKLTGQNRLLSSLITKISNLEKVLKINNHDEASKKVAEFLTDLEEARMTSELKEGPISHDKLLAEISKVIGKERFLKDPNAYLQRLTEINMFRLGVVIQCPVCQKNSWYSLEELKYELQCPKCLEKFTPPVHSPAQDMKWAYRTFGPFSLPDLALGNYSVLITLRFFSKLLDGAVTPSMSFTLKVGNREFEVDLGMLFSWSKFSVSTVIPIFGECKSFWDRFDEKGIRNLEYLGQQVPGAIFVFSTFRKILEQQEVRLLTALVNRSRKNRKTRKPYNQILILTGTELFSEFGPPYCWKDATDEHKSFAKSYSRYQGIDELCDVTQQIYLKIKPWHQEEQEYYEKKRARKIQKEPMK